MEQKSRNEFETRLEGFLHAANRLREAHRSETFPSLPAVPKLEVAYGQKNVKVISTDGQRSVYCFVDIASGDVLMAATWKAPAKHARSNIYSDDYGVSGLGPYGAKYLK